MPFRELAKWNVTSRLCDLSHNQNIYNKLAVYKHYSQLITWISKYVIRIRSLWFTVYKPHKTQSLFNHNQSHNLHITLHTNVNDFDNARMEITSALRTTPVKTRSTYVPRTATMQGDDETAYIMLKRWLDIVRLFNNLNYNFINFG